MLTGDQAFIQTYDNYGDQDTWVTVKNEFFRTFTLRACSDAYISVTEGQFLTYWVPNKIPYSPMYESRPSTRRTPSFSFIFWYQGPTTFCQIHVSDAPVGWVCFSEINVSY